MKGAKLAIAGILSIVLLLVLIITLLVSSAEECSITGSDSGGSLGGGTVGGVPDGAYSLPMKDAMSKITSQYKSASRPGHRGIDIASAQADEPLYAFYDGVVSAAGPASGFGNWIIVDHQIDGKLISTVYGHMWDDGVHVSVGDQVKAGQHIADQGSNGQSTGPHLHWEVWEGGRLSGGIEVDPNPWLNNAVEPGSAPQPSDDDDQAVDEEEHSDTDTRADSPLGAPESRRSGGELQPDPRFAEANMQVDSVRIGRSVAARFPQLETIGGWRPYDDYPDHPSGRAVDIMIPDFQSAQGKQLGDDILAYLYGNRDYFNIQYFIWRQQYIPAEGTPNMMDDRGDLTQNHFDHIHVTVHEGSGYPSGGQSFGTAPEGGSAVPGAASGTASEGCVHLHVDGTLNDGSVPPEYIKWIRLGAAQCEAVSEPLLASLIYQESQFQPSATSHRGAMGPAQFMPGTWPGIGAEIDETTGERIGPTGSGDPRHIPDALMASGAYLCENWDMTQAWKKEGRIQGDDIELMLSAYNAGPGSTLNAGGVAQNAETLEYVKIIPERAPQFARQLT